MSIARSCSSSLQKLRNFCFRVSNPTRAGSCVNADDGTRLPWMFLRDMLGTSAVFLIVACVSVSLNLVVQWFSALHVPRALIWGITVLEYLIFIADAVWFAAFVVLSTVVLVRELVRRQLGLLART